MNLPSLLPLAELAPESGAQALALALLAGLLVFVFRLDSHLTR